MLEILLFVCPSLIALDIYRRISKTETKKDLVSYLSTFGTFVVLINIASFLVVKFYSNIGDQLLSYLTGRLSFVYRYLIIATIFAVIVSFAYDYLERNFKFRVKVEKSNKEKKVNKK